MDHEVRLALYAATQFYIMRRAEQYAKKAREEYEKDRECVAAAAEAKRKANAEAGEAEPEVKKPRLETPEETAAALGDVTEQLIKKVEQEQPPHEERPVAAPETKAEADYRRGVEAGIIVPVTYNSAAQDDGEWLKCTPVAWKGSRPPTEAERAAMSPTPDASDYL